LATGRQFREIALQIYETQIPKTAFGRHLHQGIVILKLVITDYWYQ
jgi:hypothetical protein